MYSACRVVVVAMRGSFPGIQGLVNHIMTGRALLWITVEVQLNCGSKVESQGYPSTMSSCPILVTRKRISLQTFFVCTFRSTYCVINPSLFSVLSIFHIFRSFWRGHVPNFIHLINCGLMKQSVAPLSTSAFWSAIAQLVLTEMGIRMDQNHVVTITELS